MVLICLQLWKSHAYTCSSIIAVHGLNPFNSAGHALNTWRKPQDDDGSLWLRDFFPKVQPNARIFLYEYNSSPVFSAGRDSFVREANQLLDEILGARWQMVVDCADFPSIRKTTESKLESRLWTKAKTNVNLHLQALVNSRANPQYRRIEKSTHSLVFFGTPHAGPSTDLQVGLGMACAKIARSLSFQPPGIISVLEQGTLFADLLSENFRHQLENYKILSCYESSGDIIVPFDSAVLKLPGHRETQLRINADHSSMCRFDTNIQSDLDNYRKVERNLQMLCADALVGSSECGRHPGRNDQNVSNGGVDLSDVLLRRVNLPKGTLSVPIIVSTDNLAENYSITLSSVPELAWEVYRLCERASSSALAEIASDVSNLHVALRTIKDRLETDTYSTDYRYRVENLLSDCCQTLQGLASVVKSHGAVSFRARQHLIHSSPDIYGLKQWRAKLASNLSTTERLNQDLTSRSMNDLVTRLDELITSINAGVEVTSTLSSHMSSRPLSFFLEHDKEWNELSQELSDLGFSPHMLSEQRAYILNWIENAAISGRLELQPSLGETEAFLSDNGSNRTITTDLSSPSDERFDRVRRNESRRNAIKRMPVPITGGDHRQKANARTWAYSLLDRVRHGHTFFAIENAVDRGDTSAVQRLLQKEEIIRSMQLGRTRPVERAIRNNDLGMLRLLVEQGSSINWSKILAEPLHSALWKREPGDLIVTLVECGAGFGSREIASAMSWSPETTVSKMFDVADSLEHDKYCHIFLYNAARSGYRNIFESLVRQYGGINSLVEGTTPFHIACGSGNLDIIRQGLEMGGNLKARDLDGETPLHAIAWGEVHEKWDIRATLQFFVDNGADINERTSSGKSLLHLAAETSNIYSMKALIQNGLSCNATDKYGNTPLHTASCRKEIGRTAAHHLYSYPTPPYQPVLRRRCTQIDFRELLTLNFLERKSKPSRCGGEEATRTLLQYGASVDMKNHVGLTPLHLASESGELARMKALLEHGADPNVTDNEGWTALRYALSSHSAPAVELLLELQVDLNGSTWVRIGRESREKLTIFEHAELMRASELLHILREHGRPRTLNGIQLSHRTSIVEESD
ncbi:hypothetical protein AJ80_08800 [Polytolypa hystricis UAMH7299]|uniref:Uncharacterized protein n=1 Tax=Polytolypa hystricis (strain UAMH7299) TaxID=1447883 RepID=A0A2B7X1Y4_POLH7|nr:hypothetical protein AJ80_08800 [Polytolypa hystricis UAMH7299]